MEALELKFARSFRLHSDVAYKAMTLDFVWLTSFGRVLAPPPPPPPITSWSGFMKVVVRGKYHDTSSIHTIPFVHATPSDMSTLYTALLFAEKQCQKHNVPVAPITFDRPLYMKSAEIIAALVREYYIFSVQKFVGRISLHKSVQFYHVYHQKIHSIVKSVGSVIKNSIFRD